MIGLDKFREHFQGYENSYVVIGGTACEIIFEREDMKFRATKDIDIVVIVENLNTEFATKFWRFIEEAGYKSIYEGTDKKRFYRFENPKNIEYPKMIELFSSSPIDLKLKKDTHILPLHIDDSVSSLSAILLNKDYYDFLKTGAIIVDGVSVLDEVHLIPFKAKAWCELTERKSSGEKQQTKNINKHKKDIANILMLVNEDTRIHLEGEIADDMIFFMESMRKESVIHPNIKLLTPELFYDMLKKIYCI